jgi:hypothetical protein
MMPTANEYTVYRIQAIKSDGTLGPLHIVAMDQPENREFTRKFIAGHEINLPRVKNDAPPMPYCKPAKSEVKTLKEPS